MRRSSSLAPSPEITILVTPPHCQPPTAHKPASIAGVASPCSTPSAVHEHDAQDGADNPLFPAPGGCIQVVAPVDTAPSLPARALVRQHSRGDDTSAPLHPSPSLTRASSRASEHPPPLTPDFGSVITRQSSRAGSCSPRPSIQHIRAAATPSSPRTPAPSLFGRLARLWRSPMTRSKTPRAPPVRCACRTCEGRRSPSPSRPPAAARA
jgi:hypothetical protein